MTININKVLETVQYQTSAFRRNAQNALKSLSSGYETKYPTNPTNHSVCMLTSVMHQGIAYIHNHVPHQRLAMQV